MLNGGGYPERVEEQDDEVPHPDSVYNNWTMRSYKGKSGKIPDWLRKFARSSTATHEFFKFDMCSYEELDSLQNNLLKLYREELHEIIAHYEEYRLSLAKEIHLKTMNDEKMGSKTPKTISPTSTTSSSGSSGKGTNSLESTCSSSGSSSSSRTPLFKRFSKSPVKKEKEAEEGDNSISSPKFDIPMPLFSPRTRSLVEERRRDGEEGEDSVSPLLARRTRELSIDGQRSSFCSSDDEVMSIGSFSRAGSLREKESEFAPLPFVRSASDRPRTFRWTPSGLATQDGRQNGKQKTTIERKKAGIPRETYV